MGNETAYYHCKDGSRTLYRATAYVYDARAGMKIVCRDEGSSLTKTITIYDFGENAAVVSYLFIQRRRNDLDGWVGDYYYGVTFPHPDSDLNYFISYHLTIYEADHEYYARFTNDGWFTMRRTLAYVTGNRDEIHITFLESLPGDSLYGRPALYDKGAELLVFRADETGVTTVWKEMRIEPPDLAGIEGDIEGKYFEKIQ